MAGFKNSFPMTEKLYLKDTYLFNTEAKVYGILKEESKTAVVLDRSIFHPQGGGQPSDVVSVLILLVFFFYGGILPCSNSFPRAPSFANTVQVTCSFCGYKLKVVRACFSLMLSFLQGVIKGQKSVFEVNMVKDIQGIVHHYGDFKGEAPTSEFDVEENVILQVHPHIHIDMAIKFLCVYKGMVIRVSGCGGGEE